MHALCLVFQITCYQVAPISHTLIV